MQEDSGRDSRSAFHLRKIAVLMVIAFGSGFHKFQELPQAFARPGVKFGKLDAYAEAGAAPGHDSVQDHTLHPDLAVGHPEADLGVDARGNRGGGFDEASAQARVREISPDRRG